MKKILLTAFLFVSPQAMAETLSETVGTCEGFLSITEHTFKGSTIVARKELQGFILLNKKNIFINPTFAAMDDYVNAGRTLHEAMKLHDQHNPQKEVLPYPPFMSFLRKGRMACASVGVTTFLLDNQP